MLKKEIMRMDSLLEKYRQLSKDELYDTVEMLYCRLPEVSRALEVQMDEIELRRRIEKIKSRGKKPDGSIELDREIVGVREALVSLSYEPYIDDQPVIDTIYNALKKIPKILERTTPTSEQAVDFQCVLDQYWDILCQTGLEMECQKLAAKMEEMAQ